MNLGINPEHYALHMQAPSAVEFIARLRELSATDTSS